ncbi:MAG: sigma-54 dependent transcriptional regulator [Acidobacteriota bacterium]
MSTRRVLVVDDEASVRDTLKGILEDEGHEVATCGSGEDALPLCRSGDFDVVLLDVWLPGIDGLEVLLQLQSDEVRPEIVMISGHGSVETAVKATRAGAFDFLEKPLSLEKTVLTVRRAFERHLETERRREERDAFLEENSIVGRSPGIRELIADIETAAPTSGRVLILGENGTGKELVARHLHHRSKRRAAPFVEVNCAAIPDELIESELFGHARGAFTGAVTSRRGRFASADGGTLFLDEVGDMSLKTQARVLRALETGVVQPVGSSESVAVDVRVIAATNRDLDDAIAKAEFREDLYFRLNVVPFVVPPLRERREDIELLLTHYLSRYCVEHGRPTKELDPEAVSACVGYAWPGNVRELRNVVERIVIMEPGDVIGREQLPRQLRGESTTSWAERPQGTLKEAREAFEREYVLRTLRRLKGNVSATARELGLERSSLYRKARALKLSLDDARLD